MTEEGGGLGEEPNHQIIRRREILVLYSVGGAGRQPGPQEGHELAKKLIILVVNVPDGIGGAGRHPGPHEVHELAKKLIILVVTVPDGIYGAGRHPGTHEGHEVGQETNHSCSECT